MTEDRTYNGWANYATWRVNLEICDDITSGLIGGQTSFDSVEALAEYLECEVDEFVDSTLTDENDRSGVLRGWISAFLGDVDWCEIASHADEDLMRPAIHWHSGHNMPGYLPEADVDIWTSWDAAKQNMIDHLDNEGDFYNDYEGDEGKGLAEECSSEMEDLNLDNGPEWGRTIGNVAYWITPCTESECDLDDAS